MGPAARLTCGSGTSFPFAQGRAALAPPRRAPPQGSRAAGGGGRRGGSSQGRVPQGHARPGGCKPQAKVERGWSVSSNPFCTVKTAKLSPRRPLFNWEANRRKTQTDAQAGFLSLRFLLDLKRAVGRTGNPTAGARVGCCGPGPRWAHGCSPRGSPAARLVPAGGAEAARPMQAPRAFSLVLKGGCGNAGEAGSEPRKSAPGPASSAARGCESGGWGLQAGGRLQANRRSTCRRSWSPAASPGGRHKLVDTLRGAGANPRLTARPAGVLSPLGGPPTPRSEESGGRGRPGWVRAAGVDPRPHDSGALLPTVMCRGSRVDNHFYCIF